MLILTRRPGEAIYIGKDVVVRVLEMKKGQVRIGIEAPKTTNIIREEIAGVFAAPKQRAVINSDRRICLRDRDLG